MVPNPNITAETRLPELIKLSFHALAESYSTQLCITICSALNQPSGDLLNFVKGVLLDEL
jgi:hypothetical protein